MSYNPYPYHYQGFQPPPFRPMAPAASTSYQQPYSRPGNSAGSNRQNNYDMTWQHDMDEFERFLKDDKKTRKRSRSRSRSWDRNSGSFRSRSVGSDRSLRGSPRRKKGYQSPSPRHRNEHWSPSPRHKPEHQSPSPDRLSDISTDSFYDTERLLRESNRLLQKGAETHGSVSPERKHIRGSIERDQYQRRSFDRGRSPVRGRSPEGGRYERSSLNRGRTPERGQYRRISSPEAGRYQRSSLDRGRSPDRLLRNSPDRRRSPDRLRRNSPDRRQSPDRLRKNSPDRRQSPDRLRRNSPDRRRSPDLLRRNSPYRRRSPDRLQRNSPDRRQSLDRQSYRQNLPDRGQFSRNSPVRGRSHDIERKDRDVRSRGSLDTYPLKRSPSPLLDTLRELDRLEMELNISSRSRLKSANLRRGVSGAMLREDRSPERELPRVDPHNKLVQPNKTNATTRTKPRKTRWGKELPKNNANLNIGNSNNKTQGKNNANQRGGNKNNNKNKGRNQNNVNQGKNNANQKSGNNNKNQGKKNYNANMQSGKNNLKQQSGKNNQRQQSGKDNSRQQSGKNNVAKGSSARSTSDERHTGNKKDDKKKDEKKSDTSRSRSRNRSADDKNRSSRKSDTSDKRRSNSPHGAKRKRSVSKDRSKDRKSGESKTSKQSESSSSKKLKVDDTGHKKTDKKSENDDKNKNSKNDKDSTKKEKEKSGDKDHDKKLDDKKMVEKKMEETKDKDQKSDKKPVTSEKDKRQTDGEKQEVKEEEKAKAKIVEKKENEKDESANKIENKTSSSETKQSNDSEKHEKLENSGNKTEKSETTSALVDSKNENVKKLTANDSVVEKKGSEEQSSGKNEKSDKETAPVVEQSKASPSKSESEKSTNAGETKVVEKEKESDSATKKGSLVGYKIPKLPKPPTPEKTSPRLSRESSRLSEEFEDSDSDSDPSPYKSRWRSHSPPSSKTVHVHIVEGRTRNQILASSNSVVTTIKDSDPGAAERETRELLMKLLMKSQETQEEQEEENENEKVSDDTTKKGKESEVTEKTKENEMKPVVQEEPAKSNVTVAETDEKSDRLAQLLKMSKEIEEEIMKLTGAGTSSDAPKEKSESKSKATEKKDKEKDSDGNKKVDNKMDEQGKKNDGNQTKQKEDENKSDQKSPEKEDISAEDLDKVDLSSIQTKTLLSRLLKQSKMLEQQLELLSSGGTSKSEVKDDKNEIPAAKSATVSKENEKASVDFTKVASVSSSEKGKKLESPTKSSAVTSNSSASKTSVSKTASSKTPVVSYSNSLQSLKKSTSSLVSKGSQSSTPAVQVSAITSIESAPVEQVQTTQTKQPPMSKQNTPATQAPVKQSVPPAKQNTGQQNTKSYQSQNKQMAKQVPQNKQNTNKQAQKHSHLTGVLPIGLGAQTVPQSKPNVTRHPVVQPIRPNIAASRPVNPVTSAGVFNRPMVSQQIPPPTYFPPRPMVPGPSLTPLMSLPVAPIPQAMTGLFLSAPSSNPVSVPVPISTMSMSNPPMIASQNTSYQPMVSGPNSNQTMMSGPNSNRAMMSGPNSNQAMTSGPNSNQAMMSGPNSNRAMMSGPNSIQTMMSGPNSNQTMMSGPNSNQTMMGGPNSSQTLISGPNSNQPMMSGSRSMEMDSGSKFETVALNQRHQSGRNLQNIVSIPQANFTRQAKSQNSKYTRVTNSRPNLTNSGMNKDLSKGRNVFPEPGDQLESSLLSNVKDTEQQLYIRSLWGDGGIGLSDSAGPSSFSSNVSIMSSSDIGFGDEKMTAGSSCGEGFGGGPLDPGRFKLRCMNCGDIGHETRDCQEPKPPYTDVQCRRCKQHGHKGRDCPLDVKNKKKLATKKPCYECGEKGHLAKDCPWTRCFNCGGLGHKARDCNSANIGEELEDIWCQFCGQDGHFDSSCPRKNRESEQVTEEMVARTYKENELKRLKIYLLNLNNKRKMKNAPLDILMDACKYLNLGLRFKFETSVVTRVDNIELLSAALKMSGDVFLARVFGYNRQILKARLYEKALEVLLSEPENLIVEEQDPGAHGYRITKDIYDDVCEKAAQDKECQKFLIRVATQPDTKDEFFIQKIEELRQENKISQYTVIAALRERHKLIYEKMNKATLAEILSNPDVDSNATDLFQIGKNPHEPWKVLDKFVIMEKEEMCNIRKSSAFDILFYSAERNGMLLQWWNRCIYTKAPNIYKCNIWLQNQSIGEAYTINKEEAKKLAAADALSNLYKRVPAVRIATAGNHKTKLWVTYREVYEKAEALRMASININSPFERWIIQVCNEIIMDYLKRPTLESLEFKPGFSEIEIAEIRTLSSSKGLNYQLRKDATGMTVVIDKELHPMEMLAILRQSGGLNGMYSVVSAFECENISKQMEIGNLLTVRDIDD